MCLAQGPQRSDAGEARTRGPSVSSQALYHWATALPTTWICNTCSFTMACPFDKSGQKKKITVFSLQKVHVVGSVLELSAKCFAYCRSFLQWNYEALTLVIFAGTRPMARVSLLCNNAVEIQAAHIVAGCKGDNRAIDFLAALYSNNNIILYW